MSRPKWFGDFEGNLPSLAGKRIAITGTTSGTGYVAAFTCAKKGAEVFLLNRLSERSTKSAQLLRKECPTATFHEIACDLQDLASVRKAAAELKGICPELDVLANNAGVMAQPDQATKEGFDVQMQTNHLSHFLLVKELMPLFQAAVASKGEARIVNHSSVARYGGPLLEEYFQKKGGNLGGDGTDAKFLRYHHSKLANIVFTYALADRLKAKGETGIKVLCCAPGIADTSLYASTNLCIFRYCSCVLGCFVTSQTAEDGTMPLLTCIAGPSVESADMITPSLGGDKNESVGPVRTQRRSESPSKDDAVCQDKGAQELLWKASEAAIGEPFVL
jgi:NAD(P)-dependent dehydrogenase (short-subunit alcohol dehydrogenase family)